MDETGNAATLQTSAHVWTTESVGLSTELLTTEILTITNVTMVRSKSSYGGKNTTHCLCLCQDCTNVLHHRTAEQIWCQNNQLVVVFLPELPCLPKHQFRPLRPNTSKNSTGLIRTVSPTGLRCQRSDTQTTDSSAWHFSHDDQQQQWRTMRLDLCVFCVFVLTFNALQTRRRWSCRSQSSDRCRCSKTIWSLMATLTTQMWCWSCGSQRTFITLDPVVQW